jgi:hypothetical protein
MTPGIESVVDRVASLWIGKRLSILEKLCLKSFADVGQTPISLLMGHWTKRPTTSNGAMQRQLCLWTKPDAFIVTRSIIPPQSMPTFSG